MTMSATRRVASRNEVKGMFYRSDQRERGLNPGGFFEPEGEKEAARSRLCLPS